MKINITKPTPEIKNFCSRYPGLAPFREEQEKLFFGRDTEIKELYNLVTSETIVVLFAKSGVGKSSLLQAGLFPELRKNNYFPIKIRFQNPSEITSEVPADEEKRKFTFEERVLRLFGRSKFEKKKKEEQFEQQRFNSYSPIEIVLSNLEQKTSEENSPMAIDRQSILFDKEHPRLWEILKATRIRPSDRDPVVSLQEEEASILRTQTENDETIIQKPLIINKAVTPVEQIPVLVFDQFEEFFRYNAKDRHEFLLQLSEVLHNLAPSRITDWLRKTDFSRRNHEMINWAKQPTVKCIIAIRDDKLSELDQLGKYIPLILKVRYKLSPILSKNARQSIEKPALEEGSFSTRPYKFDNDVLTKINLKLSGISINSKQGSSLVPTSFNPGQQEFINKGIDGSQLQKVCTYIEKKVFRLQSSQQNTKDEIIVDKRIIDPEMEIEQILDNYYEEQLKSIGSEKDILACRKIIEEHLVFGGSRASMTEAQMKALLKEHSALFRRTSEDHLINRMIAVRLIKEEYTHLGKTYELSHDSLVNSVAKYAEQNKILKLSKDKLFYIILFGISIFFLVISVLLAASIYVSSNATNQSLAQSYFQQGNDYVAFNIWDNFQRRIFAPGDRKRSIHRLLDSIPFFDIAGGDYFGFISDSSIAVHEKNNNIYIWTINHNNDSLRLQRIDSARNMELSADKQFIAYRNNEGLLMVYKIATQVTKVIQNAKLETNEKVNPGTNRNEDDFKMNFINGSNMIGFVDKSGAIFIYDCEKDKQIRLQIRKLENQEYDSWYINNQLKISHDKNYVAIHKADSISVWDIRNPAVPRKVRVVHNIMDSYFGWQGDAISYKKQDTVFTEPFASPNVYWKSSIIYEPTASPDQRFISFYNKKKELVLFNAVENKQDTILHDHLYHSKDSVNDDTGPADWSYDNRLVFDDQKSRQSAYDPVRKIAMPIYYDDTTKSVNGRYKSYTDTNGILHVWASDTKQEIFSDTINTSMTTGTDGINDGIRAAADQNRFNKSGNLLAYIDLYHKGQGILKVVNLNTGQLVLAIPNSYYSSIYFQNFFNYQDFFTDRFIVITDNDRKQGLYLLNGAKRNYNYYRKLYPRLSSEERDQLGINVFSNFLKLF